MTKTEIHHPTDPQAVLQPILENNDVNHERAELFMGVFQCIIASEGQIETELPRIPEMAQNESFFTGAYPWSIKG